VHAKLSGYALDRADAELVLAPDRLEQLHRRSSPSHSTAPTRFLIALRLAGFTIDGGPFPVIEVGQIRVSKSVLGSGGFGLIARPQIGCFGALVIKNLPDRFPSLRFGVIEAMASWLPHVIADLKAKNLYGGLLKTYAQRPLSLKDDFMRANRFYLTCQTSDDVPYLMKFGAEDSLMIGTDYSHDDQSGVIGALNFIEKLGENGELPMETAKKILVDNPRAFYGL